MSSLYSSLSFLFSNLALTLAIPASVFLCASLASALSSRASVACSIALLAASPAACGGLAFIATGASSLLQLSPHPYFSYGFGIGLTPIILPKIALTPEFLSSSSP